MKNILTILTVAFGLGTAVQAAEAPAAAAGEAKPYPLKTCIVAGEPLGSMGKPVVHVHEGQEVQFCCKSCKPKFDKDPGKYLSKLNK